MSRYEDNAGKVEEREFACSAIAIDTYGSEYDGSTVFRDICTVTLGDPHAAHPLLLVRQDPKAFVVGARYRVTVEHVLVEQTRNGTRGVAWYELRQVPNTPVLEVADGN